ncbi:MAG: DUF1501 domain-containing protein [Bryobacterales bacterium]|nr:DUF1501 domain-containing protein [Bryobacterales bacterium]
MSIDGKMQRRDFFGRMVDGLQGAALASLFGKDLLASAAAPSDLKPRKPHHEPKAKAVIQLFMNGGPSQVDLFDQKPALTKYAGQPPSRDLAAEVRAVRETGGLMPSRYKFQRAGKSGLEISEILPHTSKVADELCVIKSMYTTHLAHEAALFLMHGGRILSTRPTLGSWIVYGLGSENQNLPAYVVLDDPKGPPVNFIQNWQAGWLPAVFQGTRVRAEGSPILNLHAKNEYPSTIVDMSRSLLHRMDADHRDKHPGNAELEARIANYELAARMQIAATDALDLTKESNATREAYGMNNERTHSYGKRCLMARRLVERGVRLVQIYIEGQIWDNHNEIWKGLEYACGKTDQPAAALVRDLKERGLLDSTLVVWGGEFGRLPIAQAPGDKAGRDHGPSGFSVWLAGGGVKGGTAYGSTDEIGYRAAENRVSIHDFHATVLHLLGLNHRNLVFQREGRGERITDEFPARVVTEIIT